MRAENTTFTVATSSATVFQTYDGGAPGKLQVGSAVDVRAKLDAATGKLTASTIRLYSASPESNAR